MRRKRKPPPAKPPGYVYFVGALDVRRVKIGFSQFEPDRRFSSLCTSSPVDLTKLGLIRGTMALEKSLHQRFAQHAAKLEWFHLVAEIEDYIAKEATDWEAMIRIEKAVADAEKEQHLNELYADLRRNQEKVKQIEREQSIASMIVKNRVP